MKVVRVSFDAMVLLLNRLSGLRGFPQDEVVFADLAKALMTAPSEALAEAFVADWLRDNVFAPCPADIYGWFTAPVEYWKPPPVEPHCKICSDTGFEIISRGGLTGARPCECRKIRLVPKKNGA